MVFSPTPSELLFAKEWQEEESIYSEFHYDRETDYFGARSSLSKDGGSLAIGSPLSIHTSNGRRTGHVKTFTRNGDGWELDAILHGEDDLDRFGTSVAFSESGNIVAIGADRFNSSSSAPKTGFVEVYSSSGEGNWTMVGDRILAEQCEPRTRFYTLLLAACIHNASIEVVMKFVEVGEESLAVEKDKYDENALHLVLCYCEVSIEVVSKLIEVGDKVIDASI